MLRINFSKSMSNNWFLLNMNFRTTTKFINLFYNLLQNIVSNLYKNNQIRHVHMLVKQKKKKACTYTYIKSL